MSVQLSKQWQIQLDTTLNGVEMFQQYPVVELPKLESSKYEFVGWDQFKIHTVDQKRLYSKEYGPCLALVVRGYDESDQLSHTGLAHVFMKKKTYTDFLEEVGKMVRGRIELFIAGGSVKALPHVVEITAEIAPRFKMEVLQDVTSQFFKAVGMQKGQKLYRGNSGIGQLYFDSHFNPTIALTLEISGIENLKEFVEQNSCKFIVLSDNMLVSYATSHLPQFE